jgi:phosphoserine phosphatase
MTVSLVVDLCGTIVLENTTHSFLKVLQLRGASRFLRSLLLSRLGLAVGERVAPALHRRGLMACLRGMPLVVLKDEACRYAKTALAQNGRKEVILRVAEQPAECLLASASLDVIVEAFAACLSIPLWVASTLEIGADGNCTGHLHRDLTGRKLAAISILLGEAPGTFHLITDNPEDTDLMDAAISFEFLYHNHV